MITSAWIRALNQLEDGTQRPDAYGCIRPGIRAAPGAPLILTDEDPPAPASPVAPGQPVRGRPGQGVMPARLGRPAHRRFRGLLEHLATLTRDQVRYTGTLVTVPMLTEPGQHPAPGLCLPIWPCLRVKAADCRISPVVKKSGG